VGGGARGGGGGGGGYVRTTTAPTKSTVDPFFVGSRVFVINLGVEGVILCKKAGGWHDVELQTGGVSRYRPSDLRLVSSSEAFGEQVVPRPDTVKEHKARTLDIEAMTNAFHNRPHNGASTARTQTQSQRPIKRPQEYGGVGGGSGGGSAGSGSVLPTFSSADSLRCGMKLVVVRTGAVGTVVGEKFGGWRKLRFSDGTIGSFRPGDLAAYVPPADGGAVSSASSSSTSTLTSTPEPAESATVDDTAINTVTDNSISLVEPV